MIALGYRLRPTLSDALDVTCERPERSQHALQDGIADGGERQGHRAVHENERPENAAAHFEQRGDIDLRENFPDRMSFDFQSSRQPGATALLVEAEAVDDREMNRYLVWDRASNGEPKRLGCRQDPFVGQFDDHVSRRDSGVMRSGSIERVECLPDVASHHRLGHGGGDTVEIGVRQGAKVAFLVRRQTTEYDLRDRRGDPDHEARREERHLPGKRPASNARNQKHHACAFTTSHFSSVAL